MLARPGDSVGSGHVFLFLAMLFEPGQRIEIRHRPEVARCRQFALLKPAGMQQFLRNSPALDRRAWRISRPTIMKKEIRLNAFAMNCVAHQSPGLWTHPRDRTAEYNRLPYWIDLAKTLERGRFDGLFLADVLGVYDVFGSSPDAALAKRHANPGQRSAAADLRDGRRHRKSRLRRDLQPVLRTALSVCAADVDARPSHRGADRLERGDGLSRQRGPRRRQGQADRA